MSDSLQFSGEHPEGANVDIREYDSGTCESERFRCCEANAGARSCHERDLPGKVIAQVHLPNLLSISTLGRKALMAVA
jgi:hypothetical protein